VVNRWRFNWIDLVATLVFLIAMAIATWEAYKR
jgi:hypothetical protein